MMDVVIVTADKWAEDRRLLFHFPWDARYRWLQVLYSTSHQNAVEGGIRVNGGCGYLFLSTSGEGRETSAGILAVFGCFPGSLLVQARLYGADGNSSSTFPWALSHCSCYCRRSFVMAMQAPSVPT